MELTFNNRVNIAKKMNNETATIKDWRIRNRHNRAMREIARQLSADKGYMIATVKELKAMYGDLCDYEANASNADVKNVWALQMDILSNQIQFVAI